MRMKRAGGDMLVKAFWRELSSTKQEVVLRRPAWRVCLPGCCVISDDPGMVVQGLFCTRQRPLRAVPFSDNGLGRLTRSVFLVPWGPCEGGVMDTAEASVVQAITSLRTGCPCRR